ncbi:hypothetical protein RhiirA5_421624 [Rhizophagus irregularis]|uniref:Uncharacterized protein n=1 Tax=Rhizophagus irregularis TaxID=588596 RepID=A0A2N0PDI9_9GLOM|nr:hypothetical protein RhiirA5_421624 [Rhizophagus irregularis]PKC59797.1 hypothetical protein RhiirA1_468932 [Rhizophagus irregularis]
MLSIFLFLDSDIVVAIAAVVVIGKAGAGADVAGTGISIGEKEGDLDFSCFYSEKKKERKGRSPPELVDLYKKTQNRILNACKYILCNYDYNQKPKAPNWKPYCEFQLIPRNQNPEVVPEGELTVIQVEKSLSDHWVGTTCQE